MFVFSTSDEEPKTNKYRIEWRDKNSGNTGKGTKHFDRVEALKLARDLNIAYPHIEHEAKEVAC